MAPRAEYDDRYHHAFLCIACVLQCKCHGGPMAGCDTGPQVPRYSIQSILGFLPAGLAPTLLLSSLDPAVDGSSLVLPASLVLSSASAAALGALDGYPLSFTKASAYNFASLMASSK